MSPRTRRRLAIYRAWLMASVVLAVCLLLFVPPALFTYGPHDAAVVLPAVGLLIGWWLTFTAAWVAYTRIPRMSRNGRCQRADTVMHTSAKEHTVSNPSPQQPTLPQAARKRRRWPWFVIGAIVVLIAVIVSVSGNGSPAPAGPPAVAPAPAAAPALTGPAAILAAAGPLHAHIENTNQLICDPATATAVKSGGGIRVHVDYPGPGDLSVAATSLDQQSANQSYTLGAQEAGHDFTITAFPLSDASVISVSVTAAAGGGTCDVVNRMP